MYSDSLSLSRARSLPLAFLGLYRFKELTLTQLCLSKTLTLFCVIFTDLEVTGLHSCFNYQLDAQFLYSVIYVLH
jgi:hypothetical protein